MTAYWPIVLLFCSKELGDLKRAVVSNKPDLFAKRVALALFGDSFDVVMGSAKESLASRIPRGRWRSARSWGFNLPSVSI